MSRYPLKTLCEVLTPDRQEVDVEPTTTYRTVGILSFGRGLFAREPVLGARTSYSRYLRLRRDQMVYSRLFAWEGAVALVTREFDGFFVSPEFPTFKVDVSKAVPAYLGYIARWPTFHELLAATTRGLGLRRQRVHVGEFLAVKIPLPAIEEQRRIAAKLETVGGLCRSVRALGKQTEALTEALLWTSIPSDGVRLALRDVLSPHQDLVTVQPESTYRMVGVRSFGKGLFARDAILGVETQYKTLNRIREGQFVCARLNAWEGGMAVVGEAFDGMYVSQEFPVFEIDRNRLLPQYLAVLCRWRPLWDAVMDRSRGVGARTGARRLRLHPEQLLKIEIPLPGLDEQRRIVMLATKLADASASAERRQKLVGALEASLLNRAFAGLL